MGAEILETGQREIAHSTPSQNVGAEHLQWKRDNKVPPNRQGPPNDLKQNELTGFLFCFYLFFLCVFLHFCGFQASGVFFFEIRRSNFF